MNSQSGADPASVRALFEPRSIALVGASEKSTWAQYIVSHLTEFGYDGDLYLVNPRGGTILGQKAFQTLAEIGVKVDVVYVMVPTPAVTAVLLEAAALGIRNFVVLTAGFGEVGGEGHRREAELRELAREHGLTILGPNGVGYINVTANTAPYGLPVPTPLIAGGVGVVLQSGALASAFLNFSHAHNVGLSLLTSMGNETVLTVTDVMDYLIDDPATKVIALFLETVRDPERFRQVAMRAAAVGKPVVVLKIGTSELAAHTAQAHTGALVGDDQVADAAFRQLGIVRVRSVEDLLYTAYLLSEVGMPAGDRMAIVTPSGGASEIMADRAADEGVQLPAFKPETVQRLRAILPDFATPQNPLDITGYISVDPTLLARAYEVVIEDGGYDMVVLLNSFPRSTSKTAWDEIDAIVAPLAPMMARSPIPSAILATVIGDTTEQGLEVQAKYGFRYVAGIDNAMTAFGAVARAQQLTTRARERSVSATIDEPIVLDGETTGVWAEHRAARLLASQGIPMVPSELVGSAADAVAAAEGMGFPVVLKAAAEGLGHKSDIGGVQLNLRDAVEVTTAFDVIQSGLSASGYAGGQVLVQPMRSTGVELIVGVVRDPSWGLTMVLGMGGIWVEILKDVSHLVLPVDEVDIRQALQRLRAYRLLEGVRGSAPVDITTLANVIGKVADLACRLGDDLESLEINPLSATAERIEALDALITWRQS
ncbi:CoA-binding protein [Gordonia sp. SID5947]|uniref:acetate--CoA ligase family protein n=1 Tax=Gordonia sp. SID5947 TaxID=2690315 RepID=UPI0013709E67|nr:acetate--CoA ligase family protein [Gordonia sp. SID5947]MYR07968.1 CoA-binding protein [Gordonia sp. SID5947]